MATRWSGHPFTLVEIPNPGFGLDKFTTSPKPKLVLTNSAAIFDFITKPGKFFIPIKEI